MKKLNVKIGKMVLRNPVTALSGTFGYAEEMKDFVDISRLGAIVTKSVTLNPRNGNPTPRIVETPSGMLNSIGLENKGLKDFIQNKIPFLEKLRTNVVVSIAGFSIQEFEKLTERLSEYNCVSAIELNLSCPNVIHGKKTTAKRLIAQDEVAVNKVVSRVRKKTKLTIITKLTPNVTDIKKIAKAAENAGSDAISLINTIFGISVDAYSRKANLANTVGGLSGPAIKPVALYFVHQAYQAVKIPIIGSGGIMSAEDAIEFMLCGATAVGLGTANFINPAVATNVIDGIMHYAKTNRIKNINNLIGRIITD
ncbi:MAG: dihydroorotate dehydrogenase [Candidatus Omnitrophica bacterium]|nr:dihydroorotate dehydrogenase [Candidatus Omnitrophota bacterium]